MANKRRICYAVAMDEGRKRVIGIMAAILASLFRGKSVAHNHGVKFLLTQPSTASLTLVVAVTSYPASFRVAHRFSETTLSNETQRILRSGILILSRPSGRLFRSNTSQRR